MAEAAGVIPPTGAAHPLFALLARQVAAWDLGPYVLRMNALSALCGVICAMLLAYVVSRMILYSASEDGGGGQKSGEADEEDIGPSVLHEEVNAYNRRVFRVAAACGLFAGILFAFTAAAWAAATRLDAGLFHLMLGLISLCLFPFVDAPYRLIRLAFSAVFFALGMFDSAVFILFLPCYAYLLFTVFLQTDRRVGMVALGVLAGLAAFGVALAAYWMNQTEVPLRDALIPYVRGLAHGHLAELRFFFPRSGWLLAVLQVGMPAIVLLFGKQILFRERGVNTLVAQFLGLIAVLPGLLSLPIAPFELFQRFDHLPVFASAIAVMATACVFASGWIFLLPDERAIDLDPSESVDDAFAQRLSTLRGVAGTLSALVVLLAVATPFRSFSRVDARRGTFADQVAREILGEMKWRTCLVTNGLIDNHLLLQARLLGKKLALVKLRAFSNEGNARDIRRLIETSPLFEGLNRQRLANALSIDPVRFVMEWINEDKEAANKVLIFVTPDIWTACGYRAIPTGFLFKGLPKGEPLDMSQLVEENRAFAQRIAPVLAGASARLDFSTGIRHLLRTRAAFAMNELGVMLEDSRDFEAAYDVYLAATEIDPQNISAAVNVCELSRQHQLHPEMGDVLRKRMRTVVAQAQIKNMQGITWVLQNYGTIRQQAFYQQQAANWSLSGAKAVVADKISRAQSLSEKTGVATLVGNAAVYLQTGNRAQAEACYHAALEQDDQNRDALIALCTLAIGQSQVHQAQEWYQRALKAGVEPLTLRYQTVMLAILKNDKKQAMELLKAAIRDVPSDSRYWLLMADQLLDRGDFQYVERQLLPDMQRALKNPDHFLCHVIRGTVLRRKGPEFFKEARLSLLAALARNASLTEVWNDVLKLDAQIGSAEFTEIDTRRLLGLEPDQVFANYLLGTTLLERGELPEAEDFLRRSIETKATPAAYNNLAESLRRQGKLAEAETTVRQALKASPDLAPACDTLACILLDRGRYADAAEAAQKAVSSQPDQPVYRLSLLRAQVKLGDKGEVREQLDRLAEKQVAIPVSLQQEINAMR